MRQDKPTEQRDDKKQKERRNCFGFFKVFERSGGATCKRISAPDSFEGFSSSPHTLLIQCSFKHPTGQGESVALTPDPGNKTQRIFL